MFEYGLFDLDGTLTDPAEGICNSFRYALRKFGIEERDEKRLLSFIGPPLADSFETYGMSPEEIKTAIATYREYFNASGKFENFVYPGVPEMLEALKTGGRKLAVATSKLEKFSLEILEHFGLRSYFDAVCGASADEKRSRKGDVINYLLQELHFGDRADAVMVGDRFHDILGAKEAGIRSIGVLYGYGNRKELTDAGADMIAAGVEELPGLIL